MRRSLLALMLFAGCHGDDGGACMYGGRTYMPGDTFPSTDGCNTCACTPQGVACDARACVPTDGGVDADPGYCGSTHGCPAGPACGAVCCGPGERCDNGVCRCGNGAPCADGDTCEAAGPVGANLCGSTCCGGSGPCPL